MTPICNTWWRIRLAPFCDTWKILQLWVENLHRKRERQKYSVKNSVVKYKISEEYTIIIFYGDVAECLDSLLFRPWYMGSNLGVYVFVSYCPPEMIYLLRLFKYMTGVWSQYLGLVAVCYVAWTLPSMAFWKSLHRLILILNKYFERISRPNSFSKYVNWQ